MIRRSCYYYEWFGDYSLDLCNNPQRKESFSTDECKGCQFYITKKAQRINQLKAKIAMLNKELAREMKGAKYATRT